MNLSLLSICILACYMFLVFVLHFSHYDVVENFNSKFD